jgi:YVTN family beta-propeller protein
VWFTLKDSGKVQVISGQAPFKPITVLQTGPITNHVNFARTPRGQFAYVTVGALRQVKVFTTDAQPKLVATIDTGDNPHGLWPSGDGSRMYVGLQLSNAVAVIDTATNRVVKTVDVGAEAPMALMYVPRAVPAAVAASSKAAAANLVPAGEARQASKALHIELVPATTTTSSSSSKDAAAPSVLSSIAVNPQGPYSDSLEAAFSGLQPGQHYVLALAGSRTGGSADSIEPIASFVGGPDGAAGVAVLGPFRSMLLGGSGRSSSWAKKGARQQVRFLTIAPLHESGAESKVGAVVQVQQAAVAV